MLRFFNGIKHAVRLNHTLVQRGPLSSDGQSLALYIRLGSMSGFELLLKHTRNPYYHERHTAIPSLYNALFVAVKSGRDEMVEQLVKRCHLNIKIKDNDGMTLDAVAKKHGHHKTAALLTTLAEQQEAENSSLSFTI